MSPPPIVNRAKSNNGRSEARRAAFTRADLLAMIGILALLVLVFHPAFASTRGNTRAFVCLNNLRQLVLAWRTYAEDNLDRLPPNLSGGTGGSWVDGWEDWDVNNHDNTNVLLLLNARLGPYAKNANIYKCPADTYLCVEGGRRMPRVRSVSMNAFVDGSASSPWFPGWRYYRKFSDIQVPSPAGLWVFTEEHPDSINDGWLTANVTDPNSWVDLPASYHDGAANFGFADGRGELKKWLDKTTLVPVRQTQYNGFPAAGSLDTGWFIQHSSAPGP